MKDILDQRHAVFTHNQSFWSFFLDHYDGGAEYPFKLNPIAYGTGSNKVTIDASAFGASKFGSTRYLWQFPLERTEKYIHRLNRAAYINIIQPVVDFYAATIGKPENIICQEDEKFDAIEDDIDLQGQSLLQFLLRARTNAAIFGHTFLFVDSTRASGPLVTQRDAEDQNIRPYFYEITPPNLVNWRLDRNGVPLEVMFKVELEPEGSLMAKGDQAPRWQYRWWSRTEWKIFEPRAGTTEDYVETEKGNHPLGAVPIVPLYHRRKHLFLGSSLLKDAAKLGQLCTNWVSALDEGFEIQMFPLPVWKSKKSPTDAAVGTAVVMHLNPDDNEEFLYVSPDTGPFEVGWDAFYRLIQIANKHMGIAPKAITTDKVETQSGVSKEWDFFEAEKVLSGMAINEQEAVKAAFDFAAKWMGVEYKGSIQYATKYDLATAADDIADLIALQSAGVPKTGRQELMRRILNKKLPSLPEDKRNTMNAEVDKLEEYVDPVTAIAQADANAAAQDKGTKPKVPIAGGGKLPA